MRKDGVRPLELGRLDEGVAEPEGCPRRPLVVRREERHGARQEADTGVDVLSGERPPACLRKALGRAGAELRISPAELFGVAMGLLEVVADDLVALDEVRPALLEPDGEALVQLGAGRLRQRVVRGVADEEVPEAVGVLAGNRCAFGADEVLANEHRQMCVRVTLRRRKRDDRAAVELLALDRAAFEHHTLLAW